MSNNRCYKCKCKISIVDSIVCKCRCKQLFCKSHRLDHNCGYDHQLDYKTSNNLVKLVENKLVNKI